MNNIFFLVPIMNTMLLILEFLELEQNHEKKERLLNENKVHY